MKYLFAYLGVLLLALSGASHKVLAAAPGRLDTNQCEEIETHLIMFYDSFFEFNSDVLPELERQKAIPWILPFIDRVTCLSEGQGVMAVKTLRRIGDVRVVPHLIDALSRSITPPDKGFGSGSAEYGAALMFRTEASEAIEELLGEKDLIDVTIFRQTVGNVILEDDAMKAAQEFIAAARAKWQQKQDPEPQETCDMNVGSEANLFRCHPDEIVSACGLKKVVEAYEQCLRPKTQTDFEEGVDSLQKLHAVRWVSSLLGSGDMVALQRLGEMGDPIAIPDILKSLNETLSQESMVEGPDTLTYQNRRKYQSLAIRTVEELLGIELLDEQKILSTTNEYGVLKPEAMAAIKEFIKVSSKQWDRQANPQGIKQ